MGALVLLVSVLGLGYAVSRRTAGGDRRLSAGWRKAFLATHVTSSVGWLGIVAGLVAFAAVGWSTDDPATARAAYGAMQIIDAVFLGYASPIALASGIVLALTSRWGLFRHWWVTVKFAITLALMVAGVLVMHLNIGRAAASAPAVAMQVRETLLAGCVISSLALLAAVVLSTFKPWGRTPRGRKKTGSKDRGGRGRPAVPARSA